MFLMFSFFIMRVFFSSFYLSGICDRNEYMTAKCYVAAAATAAATAAASYLT